MILIVAELCKWHIEVVTSGTEPAKVQLCVVLVKCRAVQSADLKHLSETFISEHTCATRVHHYRGHVVHFHSGRRIAALMDMQTCLADMLGRARRGPKARSFWNLIEGARN